MFRLCLLVIFGILSGITGIRVDDYTVYIENNTLQGVFRERPSAMNMGYLNLQDYEISRIEANAFESVNDIAILSLEGNNLEELPQAVFKTLSHLHYLSLANNRLRSLKNVFVGLYQLADLDISNNAITVLEPGCFLGLDQWRIKIESEIHNFGNLSDKHFRNSQVINTNSTDDKRLRVGDYTVIIESNTLQSVVNSSCSANKTDYLYLLHFGISKIEADAFSSVNDLTILSLGGNNLEELPQFVFKTLSNLRYLSLAENRLRNLHNVFVGLENLSYLDIRYNGITVLEPGSFFGLRPFKIKIESEGNHFGEFLNEHFIDSRVLNTSVNAFNDV